jgi:ankyrin repeat protein
MSEPTPLSRALAEGDLEKVEALIAAGADPHYKRANGYGALVDAIHGRDVRRDPRLLELLRLLIAKGVDLDRITTYSESGLRVLSRLGRFDAVRLLLDAGADEAQLGWSPLIAAVALGSRDDVERLLAGGAALEDVDWWSRTAWLVALLAGDLEKAKLLKARGADMNARGRCDTPPLHYAVRGHHAEIVRWLLDEGQDIDQQDQFLNTALSVAVEEDDLACAEVLLAAAAGFEGSTSGALRAATSRAMVLRLLAAGADPGDLAQEGRRAVVGLPPDPNVDLIDASADDFAHGRAPRSGAANPTPMREPFWTAMIRSGVSAYEGAKRFGAERGVNRSPVWCAQRFGQSFTLLPDGRVVQIGGEHEDYYDPDFCIYNDVFVHAPDGSIAIYGYPETLFPPTDFHTATLVGEHIYLIGSLGYMGRRRFGETQLFRLDTRTLALERLDATGDAPGWISRHRADPIGPGQIRVTRGRVCVQRDARETLDPNEAAFILDVERLVWRRD